MHSFLLLSVIGIGAVLAAEMLLNEQRIHGCSGIHTERHEGHLGHLFGHYGMIDSLVGILAPRNRTVVLHQNGRGVHGIDVVATETVYDDHTCVLLIFVHLLGSHVVCAGNAVVEIVGMSGSDVGNVLAGLSPSGGIGGVGVNHASDFWELPI